MSLDYSELTRNLQVVKTEIDDLLFYIETNQSSLNKRLTELEIYSRLANISTNILRSDCDSVDI